MSNKRKASAAVPVARNRKPTGDDFAARLTPGRIDRALTHMRHFLASEDAAGFTELPPGAQMLYIASILVCNDAGVVSTKDVETAMQSESVLIAASYVADEAGLTDLIAPPLSGDELVTVTAERVEDVLRKIVAELRDPDSPIHEAIMPEKTMHIIAMLVSDEDGNVSKKMLNRAVRSQEVVEAARYIAETAGLMPRRVTLDHYA
jgi:hypothetical protein